MSQAASGSVSASEPASSLLPDSTGLFTAAHLIWIGLFAVIAVLVIVWGVRQKAKRKAGEREVAEHNAGLRDAPPPSPAPVQAKPATASPPIVSERSPAAPPSSGAADGSLTQLKGVGPKVADRLAALGVTTVGQVAALTDDEAGALDAQLGPFAGRMARDRWQEQARFLAAGDRAGFEAVFGKL